MHKSSALQPSLALQLLPDTSSPTLVIPALATQQLPKIAVFKRGVSWWLVIDEAYDNRCLKEISTLVLKEFTSLDVREGTILKLNVDKGYQPKIENKQTAWHLSWIKTTNHPEKDLNPRILSLMPEASSSDTLAFTLQKQGKKQQFKDEVAGDYLTIIPVMEGGQPALRDYPSFKFLPSLQGIVISSLVNKAAINQTDQGFNIACKNNRFSLADYTLKRSKYFLPRLFQLNNPQDSQKFLAQKALILTQMRDQSQSHQNQPHLGALRFDLIKLYLSQGLYAEACGEMDLLKEENADFFQSHPVALYEGLAQGLADHADEALKSWNRKGLDDEPELNLWRGTFYIKQGDPYKGLYHLYNNLEEILSYPSFLRNYLCLTASQSALILNYPADVFVSLIKTADLTSLQLEEFKLCQAFQKMKKTSLKEALPDFTALKTSSHPHVRLYALYYSTQDPATTPQQRQAYIQALEENRFLWRRDPLEVKILDHLATLYLQDNRPDKALNLMRQLLTYYPKTPQAQMAQSQAPAVIYDYMVHQNLFTPFKAVTFYEKFKDLAPQDLEKQAQITEKRIDHYLHLKLLEKAEALLIPLIEQAPANPEKMTTLLLKLAQAQIEEKQDDPALATLAKINALPNLPATVITQQHQLQAQILTHQHKYKEALALLASEEGLEALSQRVDIAFRAEEWAQAAIALTQIIQQKKPQGDVTPDLVLNLAVAYFHAGKTQELIDLKKEYQSFMLKSPLASPFSLLTTGPSASKIRPSELQQQLDESQKFNQQLTQYQNSLKKAS